LPKDALESWAVGEGDHLELTERGIRPPARGGLSHHALDELKRSIALAFVRGFTPRGLPVGDTEGCVAQKELDGAEPAQDTGP
jgi:hypothetical protein